MKQVIVNVLKGGFVVQVADGGEVNEGIVFNSIEDVISEVKEAVKPRSIPAPAVSTQQ